MYFVGCWGRRLAKVSLCILVAEPLAWFRIHAWGACDPGFKSQRPHQHLVLIWCV